MGCCMSHSFFEKETVYEVTLDANGVAQRVPKGQGTHYIHISANNETHLEEKPQSDIEIQQSSTDGKDSNNNSKWPTLSIPQFYNKRTVAPLQENGQTKSPVQQQQQPQMREQQTRY